MVSNPHFRFLFLQDYTNTTIHNFFRAIGIQDFELNKIRVDSINGLVHMNIDFIQSSILKRRLLIAIDIVSFILRWENAIESEMSRVVFGLEKDGQFSSAVVNGLRKTIIEKNNRIAFLSKKLEQLSIESKHQNDSDKFRGEENNQNN